VLARRVVTAYLTVAKCISRVADVGAYSYGEFQFADTRKDKLVLDTTANERQIHKTEK
jgi:hypothetical protein